MVGDRSRETMVSMKDTVADINGVVNVEVLDCEGWGILLQLHLLPFLLYLV